MPCTHGAATRIALDGQHIGFTKFDPHGVIAQLTDGSQQTIHGHLSLDNHMATDGPVLLNFGISMEPTWEEMQQLFPLLGFEADGEDWTLIDDPPFHNVLVDFDWTVHQFGSAKIGAFTLQGQKGSSPIKLQMELFAMEWDLSASWSASLVDSSAPFAFHNMEGLVDLDAVPDAQIDRFALAINRHMQVEHNNSRFPTQICPSWNDITFATSVPYTETQGGELLEVGLASADSLNLTMGFLAGTKTSDWNMPFARQIVRGVPIPLKQLLRNGLFWRCYTDHVSGSLIPALNVNHHLPA